MELDPIKHNAGSLGIRVRDGVFKLMGQTDVPVAGATVTVDRGETVRRITATRVLTTGIFALALKKDQTKLFVTIQGANGAVMLREVSAAKEGKARALAAAVESMNAVG